MKLALIYFSATGNTATIADKIKINFMALGAEIDEYDITSYSARQKAIDLKPYQGIIFGAPIHTWRAPRVVRDWLRTLEGKGMKCSMFFTYGGFGVHPTHYSTKQILEEQNFIPVSSAEFLAPHTFNIGGWKAMEDRPDVSDFEVAKEYATKTYKRFTGEDPGTLGDMEKTKYTDEELDKIESFRFNILTKLPTRDGEDCSMCMVCEESCPTGAMDAEVGQAEMEKCIACLGCVESCPEDALKINDMSETWSFKLEMEKTTEELIKDQKSRIYL